MQYFPIAFTIVIEYILRHRIYEDHDEEPKTPFFVDLYGYKVNKSIWLQPIKYPF